MAANPSLWRKIQVIWIVSLIHPVPTASFPVFEEYQQKRINSSLPRLPLQVQVFGSIFQTAYYFVDVNIGAPEPQSLTVILDTGSSTQGIPCHDCEACGRSHWDKYYNRTKSDYNRRMPCGDCATCRLTTNEDILRALAPMLLPYVDSGDFDSQAAKYLLEDSNMMQCLYNVHYAEGSSLSGLFYTDVIWLNVPGSEPPENFQQSGSSNEQTCPRYPNSAGPSVPIVVPVGCHLEETHLFYDQKASGILGLEFWGNKGVPTFPTATLDALQDLYDDEKLSVVACQAVQDKRNNLEQDPQDFHYAFSLCLSPQGGVMSFGGTNTAFHDVDHITLLGSREADDFRIPLIVTPGKTASYLIGLKSIRMSKKHKFAENPNSTLLYASAFDSNLWDDITLNPSNTLRVTEQNQTRHVPIIPTLLDSGTTLTYLPTRLFHKILDGINERVTANMHFRERTRAEHDTRRLQRVSPEILFATKNNQVIVIENFQHLPDRVGDNVVEYIPMSDQQLVVGPKRLIRIRSLLNKSIQRSLGNDTLEALLPRLPFSRQGRKLQDAAPTWYAVFEPSATPEESKLVGFIDIPHSMEGAPPRALVSKLEGYNNGECWWLQEQSDDLPLFPTLAFEFYENVTTIWHPLSYLYSGTNENFWCLAIMTDPDGISAPGQVDEEIIFGSNSFVHHDIVFALEQRSKDDESPENVTLNLPEHDAASYSMHPNATVYVIPAFCPIQDLGKRGSMRVE